MLSSLWNAFTSMLVKESESHTAPKSDTTKLEEIHDVIDNTVAQSSTNRETKSCKHEGTENKDDIRTDLGTVSDPEYTGTKGRTEQRRRAYTVDETAQSLLRPNIQNPGYEDYSKIKKRERNTTFHADRMAKCISLPNLFRTSSIQEKSMKITRKRRKHLKRGPSDSNSESENETGKLQNEDAFAREDCILKANMENNIMRNQAHIYGNIPASISLQSLPGEISSDSDEYCSCNEDITDNNDNVIDDSQKSESCNNKSLSRISSIQKRSWSIRQKRRENFYKRRSMDVSTLKQP